MTMGRRGFGTFSNFYRSIYSFASLLIFYVCFSMFPAIGKGDVIYKSCSSLSVPSIRLPTLSATIAFTLLYYFLDFATLSNRSLREMSRLGLVLLFMSSAITFTAELAFIPMLFVLFSVPIAPYFLRKRFGCHPNTERQHARNFALPMAGFGILSIMIWVFWVLSPSTIAQSCGMPRRWTIYTADDAYARLQCNYSVSISLPDKNATFVSCSFAHGCDVPKTDYFQHFNVSVKENVATWAQMENKQCFLRTKQLLNVFATNIMSQNDNLSLKVAGDDTLNLVSSQDEVLFSIQIQYTKCLAAFLLWISPCMAGIVFLWMGAALNFVSSEIVAFSLISPEVVLKDGSQESTLLTTEGSRGIQQDDSMRKQTIRWKAFSRLLLFLLFAMWTGASIGGADLQLSRVIIIFSVSGAFICVLLFAFVNGWEEMHRIFSRSSLAKRAVFLGANDWFRALVILAIGPILAIMLGVAILRSRIRRLRGFGEDHCNQIHVAGFKICPNRRQQFAQWPWTSILTKVLIVGSLYMTLNVAISKFTAVLMSIINEWIESLGLSTIQVTGIFFLFGILIFLNPLVPGVPVYVSGGILLVQAASNDMGFALANIYTILVCTLLKFTAIAIQQKCFGELLGNYVSIRKFINVNSITCKAIKLILEQPGITWKKVLLLCGGPDWPTSVTTGILRLSLPQMLLGSTPIIFLIAPCVLSGSFLSLAKESSLWSSLSVIAIGVAVVVQSGAMVAAMAAIATVAKENEAYIKTMPNDEELLIYTAKLKQKQITSDRIRDWRRLDFPFWLRFTLCTAVISMISSFFLAVLFDSSCFQSFQVSDNFAEVLQRNAWNLIKFPMGYICLGLLGFSICLWTLVEISFHRSVSSHLHSKIIPEELSIEGIQSQEKEENLRTS